jgi:ubiquinone/menaquinone biosynthesis C-methylase UbiE
MSNYKNDSVEKLEEWREASQKEIETNSYPKWPSETMLKIIFGSSYLQERLQPTSKWRVLDVGCGYGNNLVAFSDIGAECHGVEIHEQITSSARALMNDRGFPSEFKVGSNRSIPYPDSYFDLVLSVNALHYESTEELIDLAFNEFNRVLKPGGALYLSTVGPEHTIQKRAKKIAPNTYLIDNFDFRDGSKFYFFETESFLKKYCEKFFSSVEVGRVTEKLMNLPVDFLVAVCKKA